MIEIAREHCDVKSLYDRYAAEITHDISGRHLDKPDTKLHYQNRNPVKLITSGPEQRTDEPFMAGGKWRYERRVKWWNDYTASAYCVFGHYAAPPGEPHGASRAICIDYGIGKRSEERRQGGGREVSFLHKLAALRFPEFRLVFDDGEEVAISDQ